MTAIDHEVLVAMLDRLKLTAIRDQRECPIFCVRGCRSILRGKDSVDHGEEDRRRGSGRAAARLRAS